jgi:Leucine-rich repeat (LRR) protein
MEETSAYIRKWIKKGLSKDGKTLDFSNRRIRRQEAQDMAEYVSVPGVEILFLHQAWIKDLYLEDLAGSDFFPKSLLELWLYKNNIGDAGAQALAQCEKLSNLRYLSLYSNKITGAGASQLANSKILANLETLDLSFNRVGDEGAAALANSPFLKKLKTLHLDANGVGYRGMRALAESTSLKSLTTLNFVNNLMDIEGLELMRESKFLQNLEMVKTDIVED